MIPITGAIKVVDYNPNWPAMFKAESEEIKQTLGENCVALHHVGSTSVPGLSAKPIIDIICGVKQLTNVQATTLESLNFTHLGEYGIPMRMFFIKRTDIEVNLHIYELDNVEIELNLLLRDYLRSNPPARIKYAALKKHLIKSGTTNQKNVNTLSEYTLGKNDLICEFLKQAGFAKCRLMHCTHYSEWETYHRINEEQIFRPIHVIYDRNHSTLKMDNHFHFILYKGTEIVSIAHVEFLNYNDAALRSFATDEIHKNHGFGRTLMQLLERWIKYHGKKVVKLHASLKSEGFYRKLGYIEMPFDDLSISKDVIDLGKAL